MVANRAELSAIDLLRLGHCAPRVNEVIIASMRRIYYTSGVLAVLVLVLFCCWHGSKQDPKQPHELASAAVQGLPIPEAPEASEATEAAPTPAIASRDAGPRVVDEEQDQKQFVDRLHFLSGTNPRLAVSLAIENRNLFPNTHIR